MNTATLKPEENITDIQRFEALYPPESWGKEIKTLIGYIWSGNSAEIIGFAGVGRSNLLGIISFNRACRQYHLGNSHNEIHFISMNFTEMRKKNEAEILKFYFISIIDSLKERQMEDDSRKIQEFFKESMDIPDQQVILQGLKKTIDYLSLDKKLTVVFLIDRFEEYVPFVTPEFFTDLRALRNRAKYKFSVVFSVNRALEESLDPSIYADYYEFLEGNKIYLPLTDNVSLKFRINYLQILGDKKLTDEKINKILLLSSGHGKLTRLAMEACLESETSDDLSSFLLSKNKIQSLFQEIWKNLTPSEQKYLKTFDSNNKSDYLEKIHLVDGEKITIPLFQEFLKTIPDQSVTDKIVLNPETKEISKGLLKISDQLTSSEYKLLCFFIQNEEKILDRDEIVNAVWKDLASTAGVTEQALDQLIFRVRKKIEDNPNSPIHLLTIKGRGFKFSS